MTDRGRPVARLIPWHSEALEQLVPKGRVSAADDDLLAMAEQLVLPEVSFAGTLPSVALAEQRADER